MPPLIDDRGRLFGRVNILDIFVLLLIVVLAVFAFTRVRDQQVASFKVRFTLVSDRGLRPPNTSGVAVGQTVRDDAGTILGKVESAPTPNQTVEEGFDASGNLVTGDSTIYSDVTIVVVGTAQGSPTSPRIGDMPLRQNRIVQAVGPTWEYKTQIRDVEVVKP